MQWPWWSEHDPVTVSIICHPSMGLHYLSDAMMFLFFHHLSVTKMVDEIFVHQKHKACLGRMWRNGLWGWLGNVGAVRRNVGAWQINRVWPPGVGHPGLTWGMPEGTTAHTSQNWENNWDWHRISGIDGIGKSFWIDTICVCITCAIFFGSSSLWDGVTH